MFRTGYYWIFDLINDHSNTVVALDIGSLVVDIGYFDIRSI